MPAPEPKLHLPAGTIADGGDPVLVTPARAGWTYSGLRVLALKPGESRTIETGANEMVVLPLSGSCVVRADGRRFPLEGRRSVFDRVSDFAYVPRDARLEIETDGGGEFALPMAQARRRREPAYGPAERVAVEIRGAGDATRQVNNFCSPATFATDRLTSVELITPAGNWSSFPPHKHDEARDGEAILEEIYYFRIDGPAGFAMHRTYAADGAFDVTVTIKDGDVFLVPGATTARASPARTTTCITSTCSPAPPRSVRWPSVTIPRTSGSGKAGPRSRRTRACR